MSGWLKLYRGFRDCSAFIPSKNFSDVEAWIWLLENAAWKRLTRVNGKGEAITLMPGQIHVSVRSLASAFGWDKKRVDRYLARLEAAQMCRQSRGQSGNVLTIENWAKYQSKGTDVGTASGTDEGQLGDTQEEGKEGKEVKEEKKHIPATPRAFDGKVIKLSKSDFNRWQKAYPAIDLTAALQSRDDWLSTEADESTRKRWFMSTSNWLTSKQQGARQTSPPDRVMTPC